MAPLAAGGGGALAFGGNGAGAVGCIAELCGGGASALEVRAAAHDEYNRRLQARLDQMIWTHPSIRHSWYQNAEGRVYILSPWRLVEYWNWTRTPDLADYELTSASE